jgi:hypothetical protein
MNISIKSFQSLWLKIQRRFGQYLKGSIQNPGWLLMFCVTRINILRSLGIFILKRPHSESNIETKNSLFNELNTNKITESLKTDGLYLNIKLPQQTVKEIVNFAESAKYLGNANFRYSFHLCEKNLAEQKHQQTFFSAHHFNPSQQCEAIAKLERDPLLWKVAAKYLETDPVLIGSRIWWTFATKQKLSESVKGFFRFHYDLEDYRFIKFMFYLTDVDTNSAPHVCVRGSHKNKKLQHQFSLLREREDREIVNFYGKEKIEIICGKAGFGFVEDFYCFHKAMIPKNKNRLMLEIKFAMNDYGLFYG